MNIRDQLITDLKKTLKKLKLPSDAVTLEHPHDPSHGDYATPVAFHLAKKVKQPSRTIAEKIVEAFPKSKDIAAVTFGASGFVNFTLSDQFIIDASAHAIEKGAHFGQNQILEKKKIVVEFTDPNPFKEFHIGHLYSNAVGEAFARLMTASGATVKRANYQGDVGMHVAKALWGLQRKMAEEGLDLAVLAKKPLSTRVAFLGQGYALGATFYDDDPAAKKEIVDLNTKIFARDPGIAELYAIGRSWSLEHFEQIYKRLGTAFDYYYFERDAGEVGERLVRTYLKKGVFEKSKGAIIFPGEKHGLHNRVFINSLGLPTYEAKELGLAPTKYKDFPYDQSIIVTGNEINAYFRVVLTALAKVEPDLAKKTRHISHGMVRLPSGKMSSRTGSIMTGEDLLNVVKKRFLEMHQVSDRVAEMVTIAAVKYSLLKSRVGKDVIFDIDASLSLEGDSGPYIQYAYVRTRSILKKAKAAAVSEGKGIKQMTKLHAVAPDLVTIETERDVFRLLYQFPEIVEAAATNFSPHVLCEYLFDLAQQFNVFYQKEPILKAEKDIRARRLLLTAAVGQILKNGLWLLGIESPERM